MVGIPFSSDLLRLVAYACALVVTVIFAPNSFAASNALPVAQLNQDASENDNKTLIEPTLNSPNTVSPTDVEIDILQPKNNFVVEENEDENSEGTVKQKSDNDALIENTNTPEPPPTVYSDLEKLPFPARKMHELILEAARSGDIEKFRPFIGTGDGMTMLSLGGLDGDPIEFLKSISGDPEGHELLAIITEILESDFVLIDEGTEREVYVWPYFYAYSLEKLTPRARVKLFRLLTYGDYQEMESFGAYIFYRLGITPQGRWRFFVAGD